jgi:phage antirepressor YoqD-like protein
MNIQISTPDLTMSSREIADLCEKRHDHILRDIEKMLQDIGDPKFGGSSFEHEYTTAQNKRAREYRLPKDLTVTLITGYRADLRYKVIKRLEELESQSQPAILSGPQLMAAALVEADATMRAQSVQIEEMREDVQAHERLTKADGSLSITDAAKNLGMRPKDLFQWMSRNGWIYKRANGNYWLGYQSKCNQGLLEHKTTIVLRPDGSEKITEQVRVTSKGLSILAKSAQ